MKIFLTTDKDTLYQEYYNRTNALASKYGRDVTVMNYDEFSRSFRNMKMATRDQRWSGETIMNKIVHNTVTPISHSQATAAVRANPDWSYADVRYGRAFWDMVKSEYRGMKDSGISSKSARALISASFFGSL